MTLKRLTLEQVDLILSIVANALVIVISVSALIAFLTKWGRSHLADLLRPIRRLLIVEEPKDTSKETTDRMKTWDQGEVDEEFDDKEN